MSSLGFATLVVFPCYGSSVPRVSARGADGSGVLDAYCLRVPRLLYRRDSYYYQHGGKHYGSDSSDFINTDNSEDDVAAADEATHNYFSSLPRLGDGSSISVFSGNPFR